MLDRLRKRFFDIRPGEWPRALGLSLYFFLVIGVFWILKPMKRGVIVNYFGDRPIDLWFMTFGGAQAEQLGKVVNMVVAFVVVAFFTWLVRRMARHYVVLVFGLIFGALFLVFGGIVDNLGMAGPVGVWTFYVTGDIWTTVMVPIFWALVNDINSAEEAERLYGIIGLGGVVGGFVGSSVVAGLVESVGREPLLYACLVPLAGIIGIAFWIHHREQTNPATAEPCCPDEDLVQEDSGSAFFEGARLVASSRYLLGIAALLAIYEMTSNVVDFQLSTVIEEQIQNSTARDQAFGIIGQATSAVSIFVQLFLTSYVMKRHGVKIALYFLPVALLGGTLGFLVAPTLLFVGIMSVSDNGLNYSINQSAREALYTPTSQDAKYKAKAFIDMFIQRAAKVLAVVLNLGLTAVAFLEVWWLSLIVLLLIGVWLFVIHHLGDAFEEQKGEKEAVPA